MGTKSDLLAAVHHLHEEDVKSAYDFLMFLIQTRAAGTAHTLSPIMAESQPGLPGDFTWKDVADIIRKKLSKPSFNTWFNDTTGIRKNASVYLVQSKTAFQKEWLENRYKNMICEAIQKLNGSPLTIEFEVFDNQMHKGAM
jgi:hypothetical protein